MVKKNLIAYPGDVQHGPFATIAAPWIALGANVLPIAPGGKSPAVAGWGRSGELAEQHGLGRRSLHTAGDPQLPIEAYVRWVEQFGALNCAVLPGSLDAVVVDVDDPALLDAVLEACGPTDYRTISGREGGGVHLWYASACRSQNAIVGGVDLKSNGGYVLAPGSIHHRTGAPYTATPALAAALAAGQLELPAPRPGWRDALRGLGKGLVRPSRLDLAALAGQLQSNPATRETAKILRAIVDGKPFASPGERDVALYYACRAMATAWPRADVAAIQALVAPSAAVMEAAHPVEIPISDAIETKWERLTRERQDEQADADERARDQRRQAWAWVGIDSDARVDRDGRAVCAYRGKTYYVRVGDHWAGPWTRDELTPASLGPLGAIYGATWGDSSALLAEAGLRLADLRPSLSVRRTHLDAAGILHVATAPLRGELEPRRSEAAERAIAALGGEWAGHLGLWLAGLLRTDVPCRALVLSGPREVGKSLLINGLARLWPDGAAKMRDVLGRRFNASLAQSWLAVADDDTSDAEAGDALAAYLREGVSDRRQRLERKHHDVTTVDGCMRFAVATNDPVALVTGAVDWRLNDDALSAFGDRLLHVPVRPEARGWWGDDAARLVEGDELACHVLWLHETLGAGLQPAERFWCPAADDELARLAVVSSGLRGDVLVRIAQGLTGRCSWLRRGDGGVVLANASALLEAWHERPRGATTRSVGLALAALAGASRCEQPVYSGGAKWRAIDLDLVLWYAEKVGV